LTSRVERQIDWRRSKVLELDSQGHTQSEIAQTLRVSVGTVNNDLSYLREQAKFNIGKYIDEKLPHEYEKCLVGLNAIVKEAWTTSQQTQDRREKIQALSLAKDCYAMKLELLTNATVVDNAIRFVTEHGKSVATVSSDVGTTSAALKDKFKTVEGIRESECTHSTTNHVF